MKVLQISAHFPPNVGGVETHLDDLTLALVKRNWQVFVLTYSPLTTRVKWKIYEDQSNLKVLRIPWISGLFYVFCCSPILEFLYLAPGLFLLTPILLFLFNPKVINGHGLVAGFVSAFWGRLFGKRVVVSLHSIYHFPASGWYRNFVIWILNNADYCLGLSGQSVAEIRSLGIIPKKTNSFTYWIDLDKFKEEKKLKRDKKFTVLFVGRLIEEKGIRPLLEAASVWNNNITLVIIGSGPLENLVKLKTKENIIFAGKIDQDKLPDFYNAADLLIVPSVHEEGFGRVILEALACATPVIGSSRGAIPEAMDESVGKLIKVTPQNIQNAVEYFFNNPDELKKLRQNCRKFAERRFAEKNVGKIIKAYKG